MNPQIRSPLFAAELTVGTLMCIKHQGLEFVTELRVRPEKHPRKHFLIGQYLLVELPAPDDALLVRIRLVTPDSPRDTQDSEFTLTRYKERLGLSSEEGIEADCLLAYAQMLGTFRISNDTIEFVSSIRATPSRGSRVAVPSDEMLREIVGSSRNGESFGHYVLGNTVFSGTCSQASASAGRVFVSPEVRVTFQAKALVSRRSYVFSQTGYGKSNLVKHLLSKLYRDNAPCLIRRSKAIPVGTVVFDTAGEYFWPDTDGRPGLCDVPHLEDKVVVFTDRTSKNQFYNSFVAGGSLLDISKINPENLLTIALPPERQEFQNVRKLRQLSQNDWQTVVQIVHENGNKADLHELGKLLNIDTKYTRTRSTEKGPIPEEVLNFDGLREVTTGRSNMSTMVSRYHDPRSNTLELLILALRQGKLCIFDTSMLSTAEAAVLARIVLREIFEQNQEHFTREAHGATGPGTQPIPTIAVIEEAHTHFSERHTDQTDTNVRWVKEGRKFDLGSVFVTQQPSSIPSHVLSQGDNWFVFHLLSEEDLYALKRANPYFTEELLASLLVESAPGCGLFWSTCSGRPYPISCMVSSFNVEWEALVGKVSSANISYANVLIDDLVGMAKKSDGSITNFFRAAEWVRRSAEQGDALAQCYLGGMYCHGLGVPEDRHEAAKWLIRALTHGSAPVVNRIGLAAKQGLVAAQLAIGVFRHTEGRFRHQKKALAWFRRAAKGGFALAYRWLGVMHRFGKGTPENHEEAIKWFRLAAEQGDSLSLLNIGLMLYNGESTTEKLNDARSCVKQAAKQGLAPAQLILGIMRFKGKMGVLKHFRCAAKQDNLLDSQSQSNLGLMLQNGSENPEKHLGSVMHIQRAAEQGYAPAQHSLGIILRKGNTVRQFSEHWLRRAAEQGYAPAKAHFARVAS